MDFSLVHFSRRFLVFLSTPPLGVCSVPALECKLFRKLNGKELAFFAPRGETLCVFITQHKLHESMRISPLGIIYHTRRMIFYFVRETNLLEETSKNCIRRRYIIAFEWVKRPQFFSNSSARGVRLEPARNCWWKSIYSYQTLPPRL